MTGSGAGVRLAPVTDAPGAATLRTPLGVDDKPFRLTARALIVTGRTR